MTKTELLDELRIVIEDRVSPFRWDDARLLSLMAEGEEKFCEETGFFVDQTNFTITTTAGVMKYAISDRIIQVLEVWDGARKLHKFTQLERPWTTSVGTENTTPSNWQVDQESGTLTLYEPPLAGLVLTLRVWRYPRVSIDDAEATTSELRSRFHRALIEYAGWYVYKDHDAETAEAIKAADHLAKFNAYVSDGAKAFRRLSGVEVKVEPNPLYAFS